MDVQNTGTLASDPVYQEQLCCCHTKLDSTWLLSCVRCSRHIAVAIQNLTALGFCPVSDVVGTVKKLKTLSPYDDWVHGEAECWLDYLQFKDSCHQYGDFCLTHFMHMRGAQWLSGRVSDSGARGTGFETYRRRVVSLSKTLYSPKVLVNYPGSDGSVPTWLKNCWLGC